MITKGSLAWLPVIGGHVKIKVTNVRFDPWWQSWMADYVVTDRSVPLFPPGYREETFLSVLTER
jgi:hypothetical protein